MSLSHQIVRGGHNKHLRMGHDGRTKHGAKGQSSPARWEERYMLQEELVFGRGRPVSKGVVMM